MAQETFSWFASVEWSSEMHWACLLAELGDWLRSIVGAASTVAVAIEGGRLVG